MIRDVIKKLETQDELPIEVSDITAEIIAGGCQDEIFLKGVEAETSEIHGAFWNFVHRPGVYADPRFVAIIPYNINDPLEWQRATCVKELMHLFDSVLEKTNTDDEVNGLIDRLLGRLSSDDVGLSDLMAGKDKLALYMGLPLLLPKAALLQAREACNAGTATIADIARDAVMPEELVELMLDEEWDTLNGKLETLMEH